MNEEQSNTQADDTSQASSSAEKQSQLATILIGVLVVIAGFLTYNFLQTRQGKELSINNTDKTQVSEANISPTSAQTENLYIVQAGDTLSSIAEEIYGNAQNWREIATANEISLDRPIVKVGQELKLPAIGGPAENSPKQEQQLAQAETETQASPTPAPSATSEQPQEPNAETGQEQINETPATAIQTYTVKRGDTLWGIAQKFYNNGGSWHKIYQANNLSMHQSGASQFPLIHAGNVLVIPD